MGGAPWKNDDINMAIFGGAIISLASILNLYIRGRITGISGMTFVVSRLSINEGFYWKYSFLAGMMLTTYLIYTYDGQYLKIGGETFQIFDSTSKAGKGASPIEWVVGGILVGMGTRLAKGCTSGHGVCGLPRLSVRSLAAVVTFLATGMIVATTRDTMGWKIDYSFKLGDRFYDIFKGASIFVAITMGVFWAFIAGRVFAKSRGDDRFDPIISFVIGSIFGLGLLISGMCRRTKVLAFLTLNNKWDPSLLYVLMTAVIINTIVFQLLFKNTRRPLMASGYDLPSNNKTIDAHLICGSAIFGIGWGIIGLCPGPALCNLLVLDQAVMFVLFYIAGQMTSYYLIEGRMNGPVYQPIE